MHHALPSENEKRALDSLPRVSHDIKDFTDRPPPSPKLSCELWVSNLGPDFDKVMDLRWRNRVSKGEW